ncbi:MAG: hypothetical protein ACOYNY_06180 [Caldilineaceae bacterium]
MNAKVSRRYFLQRAGSLAIGTTALAIIGNGQTMGRAMVTREPVQTSALAPIDNTIEQWLLNTGASEIESTLYAMLVTDVPLNHKIFLPAVQQQ